MVSTAGNGLKNSAMRTNTAHGGSIHCHIGRCSSLVGFPGEFWDDFQKDLRQRSPIPQTYFVGYCNGYLSYFPTIQAAAEGGYGADYGLLTEPGAGERLLDQTIIDLYRILGVFD